MKRASYPGPRFGAQSNSEPPLSLRDIVDALCAGFSPDSSTLENVLDRIEGTRR